MNCQRALEILGGFAAGQLAFTAKEIDQLIADGLVVDADPDHATTLAWLDGVVRKYAMRPLFDPAAIQALADEVTEISGKLESDWSRFVTSDKKLAEREADRREMRRALAFLRDPIYMGELAALEQKLALLGTREPPWLSCPTLGDEVYAITPQGVRIGQALAVRIDRYRAHDFRAFGKAYAKANAKMATFSADIAMLANNIGHVRKNPHQVVIGLAKAGGGQQALSTYRAAMAEQREASDGVTVARTAAQAGSAAAAAQRLQQAKHLLANFGIATTVAKALLPYADMAVAAERLRQIRGYLEQAGFASASKLDKWAARLLAAHGEPADVARRAQWAFAFLERHPSRVHGSGFERDAAIPLSSMVHTDDAIEPLVIRYRAIEEALVRHSLAKGAVAEDALECVGCPGTPQEVADTVASLAADIGRQNGRPPDRSDISVAVAFAKRFVY